MGKKVCQSPKYSCQYTKKVHGALLRNVEQQLANILPHSFGTGNSRSSIFLLALHMDETSQNATTTVEFIGDTLSIYGKSLECISFMVSGNTDINPCISRLLSIPFI